jgi:hypothetical protein
MRPLDLGNVTILIMWHDVLCKLPLDFIGMAQAWAHVQQQIALDQCSKAVVGFAKGFPFRLNATGHLFSMRDSPILNPVESRTGYMTCLRQCPCRFAAMLAQCQLCMTIGLRVAVA